MFSDGWTAYMTEYAVQMESLGIPSMSVGTLISSHGVLKVSLLTPLLGPSLCFSSNNSQQTCAAAHTCYVYPFADHAKLGTRGVKVSACLDYFATDLWRQIN